MAGGGDNYQQFIESVCRSQDDSTDTVQEKSQPDDAQFFGFWGLDTQQAYVYRVCRSDEDIETAIKCKDPKSVRTIEQHVASGSKYGSKYISTTAGEDVALLWAFYHMDQDTRPPSSKPLRVVRIELKFLKGNEVEKGCANLTNKTVREHFIKGAIHRSWVISSAEVIFTDKIPKVLNEKKVYEVLENPKKPPQPKPKPRKKPGNLPESLYTGIQKM